MLKTECVRVCGSSFVSHSAGKGFFPEDNGLSICKNSKEVRAKWANNTSIHFAAGAFRIRIHSSLSLSFGNLHKRIKRQNWMENGEEEETYALFFSRTIYM